MTTLASMVAATDFSANAVLATQRAAQLAREHQVPLTLLHAMESSGLAALAGWLKGSPDVAFTLAAHAQEQLELAADDVRGRSGLEVRAVLRQGSPAAELAEAAAAFDLMVLGARGLHPLRDLALGSTADRLLRKARKPVLVVKADPGAAYRQVLVLMDFSPAAEAALDFALRLMPAARFTLLHAFELPYEGKLHLAGVTDEARRALREAQRQRASERFELLLHRAGLDARRASTLVVHGDVRWQAMAQVKALDPDVLVVGKQGRSSLEDTFLGSVTRAMLAEAPCDVLVAPGASGAG